jgi:hypothetical protein
MADFMLIVTEDERAHAAEDPSAVATLIAKRAAFADGARSRGALADAGRLRPSKDGKRVRRTSAGVEVTDGPFGSDGRALAAYYWVKAESADAAAAIAAECPVLPGDEIEVRPIMKGEPDADKESKPGKIFGFGVLGSAASETEWVHIMDRIDAASKDHPLPKTARCGGLRLMPPKTGRRVATDGGRRAIFDGPFLESKEVIGGIFFLRMTNIEEAVRWASDTPFVALGTLEIRELWRS